MNLPSFAYRLVQGQSGVVHVVDRGSGRLLCGRRSSLAAVPLRELADTFPDAWALPCSRCQMAARSRG